MPNTREKLIELLEGAFEKFIDDPYYIPDEKEFADHLIANGVTVQEWISVKDRLPEDNSDVLAYMQNGVESRIFPASYYKGWWECQIWNTRCLSVTHWIPLPQPPKGE